VVVSAVDVRRQCIFAGVTAWTMSAVMAKRHCFSKCNIETQDTRNGNSNLRNFECVSESCALMIIGEYKHLCFSGKSAKGGGMQDAVTVAFETGAVGVFFFCNRSVARPD
jgi:hypothetical protein